MTTLLWCGAVGAWLFIAVFLVDGWTRPGYRPVRHPVSALALGPRGWVQTANFVVCGAAIAAGAAVIPVTGGNVLLAIVVGAFGLALIASGAFPMDAMRSYPPGIADTTPDETSLRHRLHDRAGTIVFGALPLAALICALTPGDPTLRWYSAATAAGTVVGFIAFGRAWEEDSPRAGLVQRATIIAGWVWLGIVFVDQSMV